MLWNLSFLVLLCLEIERTSITSANIKGQWKVCADWFKILDCFFLWLEKGISWERIIGYSHLNGGQRKKKQDPVSTMQNTGFTNYYSFLVCSGLVWTPNQPTNQWWLLDVLTWMGGKGKGNDRTTCQTVGVTKTCKWMQFTWKLSCNKHTKLMAPEYVRQGNGHWKQVSIQNTRLAIPEEKFGWIGLPYENVVWHEKSEGEYCDVENWPNAKQRMAWQQSTVRTKHNTLAPVNWQFHHHC